jgi:streptogramin lyase
MAGRSRCSHCAAALGSGAKYCSECGAPQTLIVFDPLGVDDPPVIRGTDMAPHARLTMLAGVVLVFAMLAVLWGLSRQGDPADEEPLGSETPEDGILAADSTTSTTTVVTTGVTLTEPTSTTVERRPLGSVSRIDPETNQVTAIETGLAGPSVVVGEGTVWAFDHNGGHGLARIDPDTNTVMSRIEIVARATRPALGEGSMWALGSLEGEGVLFERSAETGRFRRTIALGYSDVRVLAVGAGAVWVTASGDRVLKVEPTTGEVVAAIPLQRLADQYNENVVVGEGAVWVAGAQSGLGSTTSGAVWRIDPDTNEVLAIEGEFGSGYSYIATGAGAVWVMFDGTLFRIDAATNRVVATIPVNGGEGLAVGRGSVWVANHQGGFVLRIDPATNQVTAKIDIRNAILDACSCSAAVGAGGVWAG